MKKQINGQDHHIDDRTGNRMSDASGAFSHAAAFFPPIEPLSQEFSICQLQDFSQTDWSDSFCFAGKTDREFSLVCTTEKVPRNAVCREDGWRAFRICGSMDFSLIGILSGISAILAENRIGIFAVSTYDTDYILVKQENFQRALLALRQNGYPVSCEDGGGIR